MDQVSVRVQVSGEFACWTRPENKVERVSYDCMTPSAGRNILDAICWKPEMRWVVSRILVLKPIRFLAVRRMEVQNKIAPAAVGRWMQNPRSWRPLDAGAGQGGAGTLRNTVVLRDVSYIIEATPHVYHLTEQDTPVKYAAMFHRRVEKGQCFHRPCLGMREFAATFHTPDPSATPIAESLPLGRMLYDIVFRGNGKQNYAVFFDAALQRGVLEARPERVIPEPSVRKDLLACSSRP